MSSIKGSEFPSCVTLVKYIEMSKSRSVVVIILQFLVDGHFKHFRNPEVPSSTSVAGCLINVGMKSLLFILLCNHSR